VGTGKIAGWAFLHRENPADVVDDARPAMDRRLLKALTPVGRQRFYSEQLAER